MRFPLAPVLLLALVTATGAWGQSDRAQEIISNLEAEGYAITEMRRSWLGRIVITARTGDDLREVVLNRSSGEVLRDRVFEGAAPSRAERIGPAGITGNRPAQGGTFERPGAGRGAGSGGGGPGDRGGDRDRSGDRGGGRP